jgi:acyl-coenzyme A synthetase/AMP-(fatty) acid ligase
MGKPSPGIDLAVISANGEPVTDEEGDLAVKITPVSQHLIFNGYHKEVDGVEKFVRPEHTDKSGQRWYKTGDRAWQDKDGYFWFVGRDDDVPPSICRF